MVDIPSWMLFIIIMYGGIKNKMNKYQYFVNGNSVSKKELASKLKECCLKWVNTIETPLGDIDMMDYDDMLFKKKLRDMEKGTIIVMGRDIFRRTKV